jgi:hypothetical protein
MVVFGRRPAAEWTPDSRAGGVETLLLIGLAIHNCGRFPGVSQVGGHSQIMTQFRINRGVQMLSEGR